MEGECVWCGRHFVHSKQGGRKYCTVHCRRADYDALIERTRGTYHTQRPRKKKRGFWERVQKTATCWLWVGPIDSSDASDGEGYGAACIDGKKIRAHRHSYELRNGPVPEGMLVLHRCDVKRCVNPGHLYVGTHTDNARDFHSRHKMKPFNLPAAKVYEPNDSTPFNEYDPDDDNVEAIVAGILDPWDNSVDDLNRSLNPDRDFSDVMED